MQPLQEISLSHLQQLRKVNYMVYWVVLLLIITVLIALPLVSTTIAVKTTGIIRPAAERTTVKAIQSGIIDTIFYTEGKPVQKDAVILRIKDFTTGSKILLNAGESGRRHQFMHDINVLINSSGLNDHTAAQLQTPLYKEQLNRFLNQHAEQKAVLARANKDFELNSRLHKDGVISEKEFFDFNNAQQRAEAGYHAFVRDQKSQWLQQLAQYQSEAAQFTQQEQQVAADARYYTIKAPTDGIIQGINTIYTGGVLQAGENICSISPESELVAECYVSPKDIGLIKLGQEVRFQIDAFDYNHFGIVTGKVTAIDNDFTLMENTPIFKVRCSFSNNELKLKNGFVGHLKKGLSFQSRFVIGERTLWQLLWDKVDDWLNPVAPKQ